MGNHVIAGRLDMARAYAKCGILKKIVRLLAFIAIWLISITASVGTAVFCYGSDHSRTENLFAGCCTRGFGTAQTNTSRGGSVQSTVGLMQGQSSCGACVDVPLYLTDQQGVNEPITSVSGPAGAVISSHVFGPPNLRQPAEAFRLIVPSSSTSSTTVLRC